MVAKEDFYFGLEYESPEVGELEISVEGLLCMSNELLEETEGEW